jgi:hypothetical protein
MGHKLLRHSTREIAPTVISTYVLRLIWTGGNVGTMQQPKRIDEVSEKLQNDIKETIKKARIILSNDCDSLEAGP